MFLQNSLPAKPTRPHSTFGQSSTDTITTRQSNDSNIQYILRLRSSVYSTYLEERMILVLQQLIMQIYCQIQ